MKSIYSVIIIQLNSVQVWFSSDGISVVKSIILLNIKCLLTPRRPHVSQFVCFTHFIIHQAESLGK